MPPADAALLHPPLIALHVAVGVTGHRRPMADDMRARVGAILAALAGAVEALRVTERTAFADTPARLRLVTALAEGADQLAAAEGLAAGYDLQATLPLARDDYATDFATAEACAKLNALLDAAGCILELPPQSGGRPEAYAMAGRATIAHSDVLIAIWDGQPARGRGGTAEVVAQALRSNLPVIHLPLSGDAPARILWSGYDPLVAHDDLRSIPARPLDEATLAALVTALLGPPEEPSERGFLACFHDEHQRSARMRLEYPLLLAATGVRGLRRSAWAVKPYGDTTRTEWHPFRTACDDRAHGIAAALDPIEAAYAWSDSLAQHFAQTYRSGHIFNFLLGAGAVLLALMGLLLPDAKLWLATAELAAILAFVVNTSVGTRGGWHRRWLDYRQLAERIRPMRSLKLLGAARPDLFRGGQGRQRWVDWYAAGIWRQAGCPTGRIAADVDGLVGFLVAEEIAPQIAYHRASAHQMHRLDHSLHRIGMTLFVISMLSCVGVIAGYVVAHEWVKAHAVYFVFLSAGLPALGAAIFGIRMQGDFTGSAERSAITAEALDAIRAEAAAPAITLARAVDLFEAAATTMLADLREWRLAYQQRRLELPG